MYESLSEYLSDESGGVSLDWVVLTSVLVGTGLSIVLTMRDGLEHATLGVAGQLEGQVVRSSFRSLLCPDGVPGLQAREDARASATGDPPLDVASWMAMTYGGWSDGDVRDALVERSAAVGEGDAWTPARIRAAATGCELAARGLD